MGTVLLAEIVAILVVLLGDDGVCDKEGSREDQKKKKVGFVEAALY